VSTRHLLAAVVLASLAAGGGCASRVAAPAAPAPATSAAAPRSPSLAHENLNAVLWVQTAVEFRGASIQAYGLAQRQLDAALAQPSWTAALEQTGDVSGLPPAVILDLDETVLDNSPFQARTIAHQNAERAAGRPAEGFDAAAWDAWCAEAKADAVPGAVAFLQYARSRGVTPFYVSNRTGTLEGATRRNLEALGIETTATPDTMLLRNERPEWAASDKAVRRAEVAKTHRILLLIGDDLGDFTAPDGTVAARDAHVEPHAASWGTRWIVVPNPMYGSWERAVIASQPGAGPLEKKAAALEPKR
jgi:acid phosphatase